MTPRSFVKLMCLVGLAAIAAAADNDAPVIQQVLRGANRRLDIKKGINWCQDDENIVLPDDENYAGDSGPCTEPDPNVSCVWKSTPCKSLCNEATCFCDGGTYQCSDNACQYEPNGEPEAEREKCPDPPTPAPAV